MSDPVATIWRWPALAGTAHEPAQLACERAAWGKVHGAGSDFRWLALSPAFLNQRPGVEREIEAGSEDAPERSGFWRTVGDTHYAGSFYPSRAIDAAGRSSFLEKQVIAWRRPAGLPAALGALALLPLVASFGDEVWWEQRHDGRWTEADYSLRIDALAVSWEPASLAQAVEAGIAGLCAALPEEALAELYAALLAGGRSVPLAGLAHSLPPESLAALLLPLPRAKADAISALGWLPSRRVDLGALAERWDLVLGGAASLPAPDLAPTGAQRQEARAMARALCARDPALLDLRGGGAGGGDASRSAADGAVIPLVMWGPSAAGKTVLLAQLFLRRRLEEWEIYPTKQALAFVGQMRDRLRTDHLFPAVTPYGHADRIEYRFRHRETGTVASLVLEDRAGKEFEELTPEVSARLLAARGLVLLFDPQRPRQQLESETARTLEQLYVASGRDARRDERPIAICISKADLLVESPADLDRARGAPDTFVRERVDPVLVELLDQFCANYRLFPVSAAGVRRRYGALEPVVFYDESLVSRLGPAGEPFNLLAPFAWLLERVTAERA